MCVHEAGVFSSLTHSLSFSFSACPAAEWEHHRTAPEGRLCSLRRLVHRRLHPRSREAASGREVALPSLPPALLGPWGSRSASQRGLGGGGLIEKVGKVSRSPGPKVGLWEGLGAAITEQVNPDRFLAAASHDLGAYLGAFRPCRTFRRHQYPEGTFLIGLPLKRG